MNGFTINLLLSAFCLASLTSTCRGNFAVRISPTSSTISGSHQLADLKNGVRIDFGKTPNDAFVKSRTPWNDLYSTYGWQQVTSRMTGQLGSSFIERETTRVITTNDYTNESEQNVTIRETLSHAIVDSVETTWSGEIALGASHNFNIDVLFIKGSATLTLNARIGYSNKKT
ncbi:hypothetical protein Fcan01_11490 [Folsomia candida]|uniref:Uncharacterized protein n=1 Tax=Folsomia candida TaxID=158441 RepID=A0A226E866_FOLCA|nr:hypothetical protein Fcan01_11490 [Folsomia candida]